MNFDFHEQFKDYSNIDLLKIVRQPANYQVTAITAAEDILSTRQVSEEEISVVDQYLLDIENSEKDKKEKINALKSKVTDFLEPVLEPSEKTEPNKWVNIMLLILGILYVWTLFNTARSLIRFLQCSYCEFNIGIIFGLLPAIYTPFIFYLLIKRRRWGWILLFAENLYVLISGICNAYFFFKYQGYYHGVTASYLLPLLIRATFAIFLWRDYIVNYFGVTYETKKSTALYTTGATLLFVLVMFILFR